MSPSGVAVVGGGAWGIALAAASARARGKGATTLLYARRDFDAPLPAGVEHTRDLADVGRRARLVLLAVPSAHAEELLRALGDHLDGSHYVVHGVRGLAGPQMETISDVVRRETPVRRVGALGGPALAGDLLAGRPSVLVCGSRYPEVNAALVDALGDPSLRVYTTDDLRGLEWASALVGCLAIGVGFAQSMHLSAGLSAAVIARSIQEAARIAAAAGGDEKTLLGLAGYGDLLASIEQRDRPEVALGRALAAGTPVADAVAALGQRVEAVDLIPRVAAWTVAHHVRAPIFRAIADGVLTAKAPTALLAELMTGPVEDRA